VIFNFLSDYYNFCIFYPTTSLDANRANIIHWFSIKCKKVIWNVFAAKLYTLAHDFDINTALKITFLNTFDYFILLMLCIDSKSLYNCLIRLDTTQKKRLMIDIMSLHQWYERRKIIELKWSNKINNSIYSMIKTKSSTVVKTLIDINTMNFDPIEWIKQFNNQTTNR
jgi:hypothetical protein